MSSDVCQRNFCFPCGLLWEIHLPYECLTNSVCVCHSLKIVNHSPQLNTSHCYPALHLRRTYPRLKDCDWATPLTESLSFPHHPCLGPDPKPVSDCVSPVLPRVPFSLLCRVSSRQFEVSGVGKMVPNRGSQFLFSSIQFSIFLHPFVIIIIIFNSLCKFTSILEKISPYTHILVCNTV